MDEKRGRFEDRRENKGALPIGHCQLRAKAYFQSKTADVVADK